MKTSTLEAANPGIKMIFAPSAPAEYNAVLNSRLDAGSAGERLQSSLASRCAPQQ